MHLLEEHVHYYGSVWYDDFHENFAAGVGVWVGRETGSSLILVHDVCNIVYQSYIVHTVNSEIFARV